MTVRRATTADLDVLHRLYGEFFAEWPPPEYAGVDLEQELGEVDEIVEREDAFVAEDEGRVVGFALGRRRGGGLGLLTDLYVAPDARRRGLARELTAAVAAALRERGATHVVLSVAAGNQDARAFYARHGFVEDGLRLVAEIDELERRLR